MKCKSEFVQKLIMRDETLSYKIHQNTKRLIATSSGKIKIILFRDNFILWVVFLNPTSYIDKSGYYEIPKELLYKATRLEVRNDDNLEMDIYVSSIYK